MRSRSPLRTSLTKRRSALAKHLPKALTGDSHAVHQARVASRRLRETLPVVGADLDVAKAGKSAKNVRRRMRRLTRALGPVRELEVTLAMIAPAEADSAAATPHGTEAGTSDSSVQPSPAESNGNAAVKRGSKGAAIAASEKDPTAHGRAHVAAMLHRDLDKARERLNAEIDAEKVKDWLDRMEAIEEAIEPGEGSAARPAGSRAKGAAAASGRTPARTRRATPRTKWRAELADRLDTRAANLKKALDEAGVLFDSERLHQVRIALKRLRYALELAGELRVASTAATVRDLKAVQDTLGTLHDHDVLMDYTSSAAAQPGLTRPTRASLTALNGSLDRTRHELHAQFLTARLKLERVHLRALAFAVRARAAR